MYIPSTFPQTWWVPCCIIELQVGSKPSKPSEPVPLENGLEFVLDEYCSVFLEGGFEYGALWLRTLTILHDVER